MLEGGQEVPGEEAAGIFHSKKYLLVSCQYVGLKSK